jgi:GTP-binding protein
MDTPGYGFKSQSDWGQTIVKYIETRKMLRGAVLLISSEKKLLTQDKWIIRSLVQSKTPTLVVLTKADKCRSRWREKCTELAQAVHEELLHVSRDAQGTLAFGNEMENRVLVTTASLGTIHQVESGGGIGGVKAAILSISDPDSQENIEQKLESFSYSGRIIPFDEIEWK